MIRNEKGVALGAAMIFMVSVGLGSFYLLKSSQESSSISSREIKDIRARSEAKKVFSMAGFLLSNNLILCKSTPWGAGNTPNQCRWSGVKAESNYKIEDFGFKNLRYELVEIDGKNIEVLSLDLIDELNHANDKKAKKISRFPGTVRLRLIDTDKDDSLRQVIGQKSEAVKVIDNDHYIVKVDLNLSLDMKGDGASVTAGAVLKRPIAIPQLTVLDSSCISLCNASRGEHPYPACRGPFTIDTNTKTDVVAITENLGPGVLYDIDYEKNVVFKKEVEGVKAPPTSSIDVPLSDFLAAGSQVEWVDQVDCATFVENVTKRVSGNSATTVERDVSQHSEPAGSLTYNIKVGSAFSKIEPFRLNNKVVQEDGAFKGKLELNTTTIYVEPSH